MKIRTRIILSFIILLGLVSTILYLTSIQLSYSEEVYIAEEERAQLLILAEALQSTSDDLTKMARLYVNTTDEKYKLFFQEILTIRSGESKRPINYDKTYWDRKIMGNNDTNQYGNAISMYQLLKDNGITEIELEALSLAEERSNDLAVIEKKAFELMELNTESSRNEAQQLLYGAQYYMFKASIREPLQDFFVLISNRTTDEIIYYRENEKFFSSIATIITIVTLIYIIYIFYDLKIRILQPISSLTSVTTKVKQGHLDERGIVHNNDELGQLTVSFNEMSDLLSKQIKELDAQKKIMDKHAIISITNQYGDIIYINDKFTEMSGYTKEELIGKNHRILKSNFHPKDFYVDMWEAISNGDLWSGNINNKKKNGELYWVTATISPIMGQHGKPNGYISIRTNITQQKTIESDLRNAIILAESATKAKSSFLANMSHEIRTPMNAIIGFSDLALTIENTPQKTIEFVKKVNISAKHLLTIINDILDFSKIEAGKLDFDIQCFNLQNLIKETISTFELEISKKNLNVDFDYSDELAICFRGDPTRIKQIFFNLLGNAIKFTSEGFVNIVIKKEGTFIHAEISDSGVGMTSEQISTIFDSFSQADTSTMRSFGGTGLGTTISKQLIEMMDGEIWVESSLGLGSTFHFTLNLNDRSCEKTCQIKETIIAEKKINDDKYRILLAEDNEFNAELVTINLQNNLGHSIYWAKNGEDCYEEYIKHSVNYDLILMDFQMPVMDGIIATKKIRLFEKKFNTHIPIIALTASATDEDQKMCYDAGMDDFVMKPINMDELLVKITTLLSPSSTQSNTTLTNIQSIVSTNQIDNLSEHFDVKKGLKSWINEESYIKALIRFSTKYKDSAEILESLIINHAYEESVRYAHTLKGMSLGFTEFSSLVATIESALKEHNFSGALSLMNNYKDILSAIVTEIDSLDDNSIEVSVHENYNIDLLNELYIALDEDDLDPVEKVLKGLISDPTDSSFSKLQDAIESFEFDLAKDIVRKLLNDRKDH